MNQIYPKTFYSQNYSEQTAFKTFKNLSNKFHIFHSIEYINKENKNREVDFILIHRDLGVLFLEVKGGKCILEDGHFFYINKDSKIPKNAREQAVSAMYHFMNQFEKKTSRKFPAIFHWGLCTTSVNWEKSKLTDTYPYHSYIPAKLLDPTQPDKLEKHIEMMLCEEQKLRKIPNPHFDNESFQQIKRIIAPNINASISIKSLIDQRRENLQKINDFQDYTLDMFDNKNVAGFQGSAGTGKTWLAMKKAARLAMQDKTILFMCYNNNLAKYIKEQIPEVVKKQHDFYIKNIDNNINSDIQENQIINNNDILKKITITTFHSFVKKEIFEYINENSTQEDIKLILDLVNNYYYDGNNNNIAFNHNLLMCFNKLKKQKEEFKDIITKYVSKMNNNIFQIFAILTNPENDFWEDAMPIALLFINENKTSLKYNAIIIDEAQDFNKTWSLCFEEYIQNRRSKTFYCFYDDNQNVYQKKAHLPMFNDWIGYSNIYQLKTNLRNTPEIHNFAINDSDRGRNSYPLNHLENPDLKIEPPKKCKSDKEVLKEVGKIIQKLVNQGITSQSITLLSNITYNKSLFKGQNAGVFKFTPTGMGAQKNTIKFRTIRQYKGLENDIIILVLDKRRRKFIIKEEKYIAYTRARFWLKILVNERM